MQAPAQRQASELAAKIEASNVDPNNGKRVNPNLPDRAEIERQATSWIGVAKRLAVAVEA